MQRFVALGVLILGLVIVSGLILRQEPRQSIRIGYVESANHLPFMVAMDQGYFTDEGLEVEAIKTASTKELMDALIAGRIEAAAPMSLPSILGVLQNQPDALRLVLPLGETVGKTVSYLLVSPNSNLKSYQDLRGQKVGTYTGVPALVNLKLILTANGLDPDQDVTIVQVAPDIAGQALAEGQFSALFLLSPNADIALAKGLAKVFEENPQSRHIIDPFVAGAVSFPTKLVNEQPAMVAKIVRVYERAIAESEGHPEKARESLAKWTPIEPELVRDINAYQFFPLNDQTRQATQQQADSFLSNRIIERPVNLSNVWLTADDLKSMRKR